MKLHKNPTVYVLKTPNPINLAHLFELRTALSAESCTAHMAVSFADLSGNPELTVTVLKQPAASETGHSPPPGLPVATSVIASAHKVISSTRFRCVVPESRGMDDWFRRVLHWAFQNPRVKERVINTESKRPRDGCGGGGALVFQGARHMSLNPADMPPEPPAGVEQCTIKPDGSVAVRVAGVLDDVLPGEGIN